jgi:hypothetical protein
MTSPPSGVELSGASEGTDSSCSDWSQRPTETKLARSSPAPAPAAGPAGAASARGEGRGVRRASRAVPAHGCACSQASQRHCGPSRQAQHKPDSSLAHGPYDSPRSSSGLTSRQATSESSVTAATSTSSALAPDPPSAWRRGRAHDGTGLRRRDRLLLQGRRSTGRGVRTTGVMAQRTRLGSEQAARARTCRGVTSRYVSRPPPVATTT